MSSLLSDLLKNFCWFDNWRTVVDIRHWCGIRIVGCSNNILALRVLIVVCSLRIRLLPHLVLWLSWLLILGATNLELDRIWVGNLLLLLPLRLLRLSTLLIVVLLRDISNNWVRHWQRIAIFIKSAIIILVVMLNYSNYFDILLIIEIFVTSTTLAYAAKNDRNNYNEKHYDNS